MYADKPVTEFLAELSSGSPTPGGGSAAALSGAIGASLVSMVCNLTIGREKYKDVEGEMREILSRADELRAVLLRQIDADMAAYGELAAALKLPRGSEAEKAARAAAVQRSLVTATKVPLEIARLCREVMNLCKPLAEKGNVSAVSDAGVGVLAAEAGLRSAALNVQINLGSLKDATLASEVSQALAGYLEGSREFTEEVMRLVAGKL